jgi:Ca-activated chloride channel family protein
MWGQSQGPGTEFTIHAEVDLRSIAVRVTDRKDNEIHGLIADQFSLFENGVRQKIAFFDAEEQPVSVGILLDVSGSMGESGKLDEAKRVLPRLISDVPHEDEMFLLRFHEKVDEAVGFTTDHSRILSALSASTATRYTTRLYDAVAMALCYMRGASHRRRALLIITDGADQESHRTLDNLIRIVQASQTQVFIVGYFSPVEHDLYRRSLPHKIALVSNQEIDNPLLAFKRMADESGAECFFPWTPDRFQQALHEVAHQLRAQYTLSYYPEAGVSGFRRIEVRVSQPGARVRTRGGFDWSGIAAALGAPPSWGACEQEPLPPYPYESKLTVKEGCTLYHDDFQSDASGWPNRERFHYASSGAYQIVTTWQTAQQQGHFPVCMLPTVQPPPGDDEIDEVRGKPLAAQGVLVANGPSFGDFDASVSVDVKPEAPSAESIFNLGDRVYSTVLEGASAGLLFHLGDRGYYAVIVSRDPHTRKWTYKLVKKFHCEAKPHDLLPWKELPRNEKSPIQIAVQCRGGVITILDPGDSPYQIEDHDFKRGLVGIVLYGVGRATLRDLRVETGCNDEKK